MFVKVVVTALLCVVALGQPTQNKTTAQPFANPSQVSPTSTPFGTTPTPTAAQVGDVRGDIVSCLTQIAVDTGMPTPNPLGSLPSNYTHTAFKTICRAKDAFIQCVDSKLKNSSDQASNVFKPLFDVSTLSLAYSGLCDNLTTVDDADLNCLANTSALLPCYAQFNNYLSYLTVVVHFGSTQRQMSPEDVKTLMCSLTERRTACEVAVLRNCSERMSEVMAAFYDRSLPTACRADQSS